jgi:hypothetical protein
MDPTAAVIWILLVSFALTVLLALASLPGWIRLADYYKRKLFQLVVLQAAAGVIAFGGQALQGLLRRPVPLRTFLTEQRFGWHWQYAERSWRTRMTFLATDTTRLVLAGRTVRVCADGEAKIGSNTIIINWASEPFEVPPGASRVTFEATRTFTTAAGEIYPEFKALAGRPVKVRITVEPKMMLEGSATNVDPPDRSRQRAASDDSGVWAVVLTPALL